MRLKSKKLKMLIIALFALITTVTPLGILAEPMMAESNGIQITVEGGFDGIAKLGAWSPFRITINSPGREIKGEIQIEASLDPGRNIILAKPVEIAPGGVSDFYFEAPVVTINKEIIIRLVENKKTLAEVKYSFERFLRPETILIGVLSEDPEAFSWLNGYTVPVYMGGVTHEKLKLMIAAGELPGTMYETAVASGATVRREAVVVPLDRDSFPENQGILDGFNFLLISRFDTKLLSEAQVKTLEDWIDAGGYLMLGTGLSWQKVYNGLPQSLKPYSINGVRDFSAEKALKAVTGHETYDMTLKIADGNIGFEYIPSSKGDYFINVEQKAFLTGNDIIAGNDVNPLVIKYAKGAGSISVFTFDPSLEPFSSWNYRSSFMENIFLHIGYNDQRYYEYNTGYFQKQSYSKMPFQNLINDVPSDKNPPFLWIFISLGIYVALIGPILYFILKKKDRRDWAWVIIPLISIVFLGGMYVFGFRTRYNSAVTNTVSLIEAKRGSDEATVTSAIGVFNNRRGTLKMEYGLNNGIQMPFLQYNDSRYYGGEVQGQVVGKYTESDNIEFEQYNVMLWTPSVLNAVKTIPFDGNLLKDVYIKDGFLKGSITNTTPYDLLDAVILFGRNLIPIGDIISGDTMTLNIPFDDSSIYKSVDSYLDGEFTRSYYNNPADYPPNYKELLRKRNLLQNYLYDVYNSSAGAKLNFIARNEQVIDYGLSVNNKKPEEYNHNLISLETELVFKAGEITEIPGGIIQANMYQSGEIGWIEENSIRVNNTGDMEFRFILPEKIEYTEISVSVEKYIPLYLQYNMQDDPNYKLVMPNNEYEYYLYNTNSRSWDPVDAKATISDGVKNYIGAGNEVLLRISVIELGQPDLDIKYNRYEMEYLSMPEISVKGVAK